MEIFKSKRCVLGCFLKDSGRLFQSECAKRVNAFPSALLLTRGTDRQISLFDFSQQDGSEEEEWSTYKQVV